jgi:hypothetical protein
MCNSLPIYRRGELYAGRQPAKRIAQVRPVDCQLVAFSSDRLGDPFEPSHPDGEWLDDLKVDSVRRISVVNNPMDQTGFLFFKVLSLRKVHSSDIGERCRILRALLQKADIAGSNRIGITNMRIPPDNRDYRKVGKHAHDSRPHSQKTTNCLELRRGFLIALYHG